MWRRTSSRRALPPNRETASAVPPKIASRSAALAPASWSRTKRSARPKPSRWLTGGKSLPHMIFSAPKAARISGTIGGTGSTNGNGDRTGEARWAISPSPPILM